MKLACAKCNRQMVLKNVGIDVIETFTEIQEPYQIWSADLWECPECGNQVAAGFGDCARYSHYSPMFAESMARTQASAHIYMNDRPGGPKGELVKQQ